MSELHINADINAQNPGHKLSVWNQQSFLKVQTTTLIAVFKVISGV